MYTYKYFYTLLSFIGKSQKGQTLMEYSLILLLIVIVAIVAVTLLGNVLAAAYQRVVNVF